MVTSSSGSERDLRNPELALAIGYAPPARRAGLAALFELDRTLGRIVAAAREPLVGQMRLTWWHGALSGLDGGSPPAEPILQALAGEVLAQGVSGERLAGLVDGWEALLAEPLDDGAIAIHARERGSRLFALAAALLRGETVPAIAAAGEGWALADLARHLNDPALAAHVLIRAEPRLAEALRHRWDRPVRPLGALAVLARRDMSVPLDRPLPIGSPARVARLLAMALTGR